jgi:Family of unknown function (DUF6325)
MIATLRAQERSRGHQVTDAREPPDRTHGVATDLVQYVVVVAPDQDALATVVPALSELVQSGKIRILDLVVLVRDREDAVTVLELEAVESLAALQHVEGEHGGMLSENDIALASHALRPGTAGIVLVTEDRWAAPLSVAARRAGGLIVAGERIPPSRVEQALAGWYEDEQGGA